MHEVRVSVSQQVSCTLLRRSSFLDEGFFSLWMNQNYSNNNGDRNCSESVPPLMTSRFNAVLAMHALAKAETFMSPL